MRLHEGSVHSELSIILSHSTELHSLGTLMSQKGVPLSQREGHRLWLAEERQTFSNEKGSVWEALPRR